MLRQAHTHLRFSTAPRSMVEITGAVDKWLAGIDAVDGVATLLLQHTSASLTLQENADPDVGADLLDMLDDLAPQSRDYRHRCEGADDMPAHVKTMVTGASCAIPVVGGRLDLGTWQGLFLIEHRARGRSRSLSAHYLGS